jgi:hypothetical protein
VGAGLSTQEWIFGWMGMAEPEIFSSMRLIFRFFDAALQLRSRHLSYIAGWFET